MRVDHVNDKGMRIFALSCVLGLTLTTHAVAGGLKDPVAPPMEERGRNIDVSANVALTTDYIFRGQSQTDENVAIQGGLDVTWNAFYIGLWASNLDFGGAVTPAGETVDVADIEIDWYAGFKKSFNSVEFKAGVIYYSYPNAFDPGADLDYVELTAGISGKLWMLDAGFTSYWSPDYTGQTGDTVTFEGTLGKSFNRGWSIDGLAGYISNLDDNAIILAGTPAAADEYWYWNLGVSKTIHEKVSLDVRYHDTDQGGTCGNVTLFQCDARVVGTIKAEF